MTDAPMNAVLTSIRTWGEMVKFSHSVFALPFAIVAAFLAGRHIEHRQFPYWGQLGLIVLCMVAARSVAMTFNRIVDAQIDARNPRTAGRPLPSGRITRAAAWIMLFLSAITFGVGCLGFHVWYGNTWPILLSGPVLCVLCGYSLTKRFTKWSHFYLGASIAISPVAAWIAVSPESLGVTAFLLMGVVTCWIGGFDVIYACQDIDIDRRERLHSLPSRLGPTTALWIARVAHGLVVVGLVALGIVEHLGAVYAVGVAAAALLLVIENALVHPGDYSKVNVAFFTLNGLVSLLFAGTTLMDLVLNRA